MTVVRAVHHWGGVAYELQTMVHSTTVQTSLTIFWSLLGLAQSLDAQGDEAKALWAQQGFEAAWARADVELERSRL